MFLSGPDLEYYVREKVFSFSEEVTLTRIGTDFRVRKFLARRPGEDILLDEQDASANAFRMGNLRALEAENVLVLPGSSVYGELLGTISIPDWAAVHGAVRTTAARSGVRANIAPCDSGWSRSTEKRKTGAPLVRITTDGTKTRVYLDGPLFQLIYQDTRSDNEPLSNDMVRGAVDRGELCISREGNALGAKDLIFHGRMVLTLAPDIQVYNDCRILKSISKRQPEKFYHQNLEQGPYSANPGAFVLGATAECLDLLPPEYLAVITEGGSSPTSDLFTSISTN